MRQFCSAYGEFVTRRELIKTAAATALFSAGVVEARDAPADAYTDQIDAKPALDRCAFADEATRIRDQHLAQTREVVAAFRKEAPSPYLYVGQAFQLRVRS